MRTFLRLEHLFKQTGYALQGFSIWDSRTTINGLVLILDILSRNDLKNEILKELERLQKSLNNLRNIPGVDKKQLENILNQITIAQNELHQQDGQFAALFKDNELINSLRQRSTITGGDCNFDLPAYHYWLNLNPDKRIEQLSRWFDNLEILKSPIMLILAILRESSEPGELQAEKGFYQQTLDPTTPVQLLRVLMPYESDVFPEISAGKHRFTVRFLTSELNKRPVQTEETIDFNFSICAL
jgi:cell division protein ZapD